MSRIIWFDYTNPPHVNLFLPVMHHMEAKGNKIISTARHFVETASLLNSKGIPFTMVGKHGGKTKAGKIGAYLSRDISLLLRLPRFEVSISSNYEAPQVSWLRGKKSIVFDDNDISPNWLYSRFASFVICPEAIDRNAMISMGVKPEKLVTYNGYKEDVYIAGFKPDPSFLKKIPFSDFITVRPENLYASYVKKGSSSIVTQLLKKLTGKGFNILYLPRYDVDHSYAFRSENIFIPEKPLNGLDVCYYSRAVLTGAGTFSREAALMGKPAVSFFAGERFLSVDKKLFSEDRIFFSRNPDEIVDFVCSKNDNPVDLSRSKKVRDQVFGIIDKIL
jgi:uncharacterized protein